MRGMGYNNTTAFIAALMQVEAAVFGHAHQVLVEAYHIDIFLKLLVPPPQPSPLQLFSATTFELDASNAGLRPRDWTCTRCLW